MTMTKRELVNAILLSIGYVLLFLGVAHKIDFITQKYAVIAIIAGLIILYFRKELSNKIPVKVAGLVIVQTMGLILLGMGLQSYIGQFQDQLWLAYIIIGAVIYSYAGKISKAVTEDDENINL